MDFSDKCVEIKLKTEIDKNKIECFTCSGDTWTNQ